MRHRVKGKRLSRSTGHRKALRMNLATALLEMKVSRRPKPKLTLCVVMWKSSSQLPSVVWLKRKKKAMKPLLSMPGESQPAA